MGKTCLVGEIDDPFLRGCFRIAGHSPRIMDVRFCVLTKTAGAPHSIKEVLKQLPGTPHSLKRSLNRARSFVVERPESLHTVHMLHQNATLNVKLSRRLAVFRICINLFDDKGAKMIDHKHFIANSRNIFASCWR